MDDGRVEAFGLYPKSPPHIPYINPLILKEGTKKNRVLIVMHTTPVYLLLQLSIQHLVD